ncbi:hypothetical protein ACFL02_04455 [Planctomycetota bacterium]
MIKWIWYANIAVILTAVLVLIIGLSRLTIREPLVLAGSSDTADTEASGPSAAGAAKAMSESALVSAARKYADRWKEPKGSVQITLKPDDFVSDLARWQIDGGPWQLNNAIVDNLPVGKHKVAFKPVADWNSPKDITINVARRKTSTAKGLYQIIKKGSLTVKIEPQEALKLKPQWKIGNSPWQNSGDTVSGILAGNRSVTFKNIDEWNTPPDLDVVIAHEKTTQASATYVIKPVGSLKVILEPQLVQDTDAQWRLDDGPWQNSGATLNKIPAGSQQIRFKDVEDWWKPDQMKVEIAQDQTTEASATYTLKTYGSVTVTIGPEQLLNEGAQWRVDSNPWRNSGAVDDKVLVGSVHMVTFKSIKGWGKVAPINVEVEQGQLVELSATYNETKPPPPSGLSIKTTLAIKDKIYLGKAWIRMIADNETKLFSVGDAIGNYKIHSITEGTVNFTRGHFKYAMKVPEPKVGDAIASMGPDNPQNQADLGDSKQVEEEEVLPGVEIRKLENRPPPQKPKKIIR